MLNADVDLRGAREFRPPEYILASVAVSILLRVAIGAMYRRGVTGKWDALAPVFFTPVLRLCAHAFTRSGQYESYL